MKPIFRSCIVAALPFVAIGCGTATGNTATAPSETATDTNVSNISTINADAITSTNDASTPDTMNSAAPESQVKSNDTMAEKPAADNSKTYRKAAMPPGAPADYTAAMKAAAVPMPPKDFKVADAPRLKVTTNKGSFTLQLNAKEAPLHTKSFVYLSKRGFYNGTVFHRFADLTGTGGNIIQGGDPLSKKPATKQYAGLGGPGYEVPREKNKLTHEKLVIAMARSSDPDSAGSQFYITQAAVPFLDEGDGYTVFGKVTQGADVAMKLRQDDSIKTIELLK